MVNNNLVNVLTGTKIHGTLYYNDCNKNKTGWGDSSKTIVVAIEEPPKCEIKHVAKYYSSLEKKHVKQNI